MNEEKCLICGGPLDNDADDDQICDACEVTRDELSNGKGENKQNMPVHRWFANKACPGDYIYGKLGSGGAIVSSSKPEPAQPVKPSVPDTKFPYLVIITGSTVNYRKGPGTNYPIVGQVHKNEVYTIVDESKGSGASMWGKLKSGAGWVSLDYCKRK